MRPSDDDLSLTRRLHDAGKILGIDLHDHIIIADGSAYTSLKKDGII
jgi:DNA repair protein RadC